MTLPGWIVRRTLARLKEKRKLQQELNVLLRNSLNAAQSRSFLCLALTNHAFRSSHHRDFSSRHKKDHLSPGCRKNQKKASVFESFYSVPAEETAESRVRAKSRAATLSARPHVEIPMPQDQEL
jgi:hypothetical protein